MNDTELLKHILGHLVVTKSGDLNWPYSDLVEGLRNAGENSDVVEALVKRRSELYDEVNNGKSVPCFLCGNNLDIRYWCYDCNDASHPA